MFCIWCFNQGLLDFISSFWEDFSSSWLLKWVPPGRGADAREGLKVCSLRRFRLQTVMSRVLECFIYVIMESSLDLGGSRTMFIWIKWKVNKQWKLEIHSREPLARFEDPSTRGYLVRDWGLSSGLFPPDSIDVLEQETLLKFWLLEMVQRNQEFDSLCIVICWLCVWFQHVDWALWVWVRRTDGRTLFSLAL
jgi:hypothetical protein